MLMTAVANLELASVTSEPARDQPRSRRSSPCFPGTARPSRCCLPPAESAAWVPLGLGATALRSSKKDALFFFGGPFLGRILTDGRAMVLGVGAFGRSPPELNRVRRKFSSIQSIPKFHHDASPFQRGWRRGLGRPLGCAVRRRLSWPRPGHGLETSGRPSIFCPCLTRLETLSDEVFCWLPIQWPPGPVLVAPAAFLVKVNVARLVGGANGFRTRADPIAGGAALP